MIIFGLVLATKVTFAIANAFVCYNIVIFFNLCLGTFLAKSIVSNNNWLQIHISICYCINKDDMIHDLYRWAKYIL